MNDIFSIEDFSFPKDFIWGSATAGHQVEGNNFNSDWYAKEKLYVEELKDPDWELSGKACNSYEMFEEDAEIIKKLGHNTYRMSMEWARIEPQENQFDEKEVEHYVKVFESLKSRGIKICLTLVHFSVPNWSAKKQDFYNYDNLPIFERYLNYILPKIAKYVDYWCVFNEANSKNGTNNLQFRFNFVRFHARAYHIIKQYSSMPISSAIAFIQHFAKRQWDKFDLAMQNYQDICHNEYFFHAIRTGELVMPGIDAVYDKEIKDSCDYWAINYYLRRLIDSRVAGRVNRYSFNRLKLVPESKFYLNEFNPECTIHNLTRLKDKPVLITENGISCVDDRFRIVWLTEYLCAVKEAMNMGVDVMGYLYWSLLDNYEWGSFSPKFGLVSVDRENEFKRTIKPSAYFYRDIIKNNGFTQEILRNYLTDIPKMEELNINK